MRAMVNIKGVQGKRNKELDKNVTIVKVSIMASLSSTTSGEIWDWAGATQLLNVMHLLAGCALQTRQPMNSVDIDGISFIAKVRKIVIKNSENALTFDVDLEKDVDEADVSLSMLVQNEDASEININHIQIEMAV